MNGHELTYLLIVLATFGGFALAIGYASWRETRSGTPEGVRAPHAAAVPQGRVVTA